MNNSHKETWWGVRPATCISLWVVFFVVFSFHSLLVLVALPRHSASSSGIPAVSGTPSWFPEGTVLGEIELGRRNWVIGFDQLIVLLGVKVKPEAGLFSQPARHFLSSCLFRFLFALLCKMYFHWVFYANSFSYLRATSTQRFILKALFTLPSYVVAFLFFSFLLLFLCIFC